MRLFITGTDTEVGKTLVTACIARHLRTLGSVIAAKPVATGVEPPSAGEDASFIAAAAGHAPVVFGTWRTPVSPHRAAELEGVPAPADLGARIQALSADYVLVEGVGGWCVPISLDPPIWVEDLARATHGPVIVVAANRLGVLNHTLLTVQAILRAGFDVAGIVVNDVKRATEDASRTHNVDDLRRLLDVPVWEVPHLDPREDAELARIGAELTRDMVRTSG